LVCSVTLLGLLLVSHFCHAQVTNSLVQGKFVPTLEALPHIVLPHSTFKGWCGQKDRFLLNVNGQLEAYDASVKSSTIAVSSSWPFQCSVDGQQLVYVDTRMGYITKIDIASGAARQLGSYQVRETNGASPSFSPDLQKVASDRPLQLTADAGNLTVIPVNSSGKENLRDIKWSDDSSKLFVAYFTAIEVFDANGGKIGSGSLPKGSYFRDGWFDANGEALFLYLALDSDESGPGLLIKCRIGDWKCDRPRSKVAAVSVGGRGIVGTIVPQGKAQTPAENDDSTQIYDKYAAELRDRASNVLARETLVTATGRTDFKLRVAPSGKKAILTWYIPPTAECRPPDGRSSYCEQGMMIDLAKVVK